MSLSRRRALAGIGGGAVAGALLPSAPAAAQTRPSAATPGPEQIARETLDPEYSEAERAEFFVDNPGSDYMAAVVRAAGIDYLPMNAGSTFRGLHESVINALGNQRPEILTALHEEQAAAMAHGYAKVDGGLMAVACHGVVGLQHAAMAVYNAWCDQAPMVVIAGNHSEAGARRSTVNWTHSAQDPAKLVRDFTKWDDNPASLTHFGESFMRAVRIARTPPMGPVVIVVDGELQEEPVHGRTPPIPRLSLPSPPVGDGNALAETAAKLAAAQSPLIIADRLARTPAGMARLVELAEALQAPVLDQQGRTNFPTTHYLAQSGRGRELLPKADVILALEVEDLFGQLNFTGDRVRPRTRRLAKPEAFVISISAGELPIKANYQNFQRYYAADIAIAGDGEATLPALIEAVKRAISVEQRSAIAAREEPLRAAWKAMRVAAIDAARLGWDASPVSTARLHMELWDQIRHHDWAMTSGGYFQGGWAHSLWDIDKHYQTIGGSGGFGLGYGLPASVGAALAHRKHGRLTVNVQSDGDLLYCPGALWTAAHHNIPLLSVMHNNGGYHQEVMHIQRMASRRRRGLATSAHIGNVFTTPSPDYGTIAKGMGVWSSGPIDSPGELRAAIAKAIQVVSAGEPALIDVVCQPR